MLNSLLFTNLLYIIFAYFVFSVLGLALWPLMFRFFPSFGDRGWGVAKILGWALAGWMVWFLGSLKIVPFSEYSCWASVFLLGVFAWWPGGKELKKTLKEEPAIWRRVILQEVIFLLLFLALCLARGFYPGIANVEKPMDFAFVNSILRSRFFPPKDPWLAGQSINYYYFGHYLTAFFAKLSGLSSSLVFNLTSVGVIVLAGQGLLSLGAALTNSWGGGWLTCFFGVLSGNLHFPLRGWWDTDPNTGKYFYPRATRIVPYTINEFPAYSFLLGDLHAHVLGLPLLVLGIYWLAGWWLSLKQARRFEGAGHSIIFGVILGVCAITNSWDALALTGLWLVSALFFWFLGKRVGLAYLLKSGLTVSLTALLVSLPFLLSFKSPVGGIGLVRTRSPLDFYLVFFGGQLILLFSSLLALLGQLLEKKITGRVIKEKLFSKKGLFGLSLLAFSFLWLLLPERVYLKDIFDFSNPPYYRANTMFKLHFEVWVILTIACVFVWWAVCRLIYSRALKVLLTVIILLLVFAQGIYLPQGLSDASGGWSNFYGLDGRLILERDHPEDAAALAWLGKNVAGQPVILEAVGSSYTHYARVSSWTGLPTVVGWVMHQWQWRGEYAPYHALELLVKGVYETGNPDFAKEMLLENKVAYVYIGPLEKQQYPNLDIDTLKLLGEVVYNSQEVIILKVYGTK